MLKFFRLSRAFYENSHLSGKGMFLSSKFGHGKKGSG